jgi:hypothetical protein
MAEESKEQGAAGTPATGNGKPLPVDFWVGVSLVSASVLLFLLGAAGAFGTGSAGEHAGPAPAETESLETPAAEPAPGPEPEETPPPSEAKPEDDPEPAEPAPEPVKNGGVPVFVRPDADPVDLGAEKVLVLPVDTWVFFRLKLDEGEISQVLVEECRKAFGDAALSTDPARAALESAGLASTGRRLAYGSYHMIDFHGSWDLTKDTCGRRVEEVPGMVRRVVALVTEKLGMKTPPRFCFAFAVDGLGVDKARSVLKCRVTASLFDARERRIHSCAFYTVEIPLDRKKALDRICALPAEAVGALLAKAAK